MLICQKRPIGIPEGIDGEMVQGLQWLWLAKKKLDVEGDSSLWNGQRKTVVSPSIEHYDAPACNVRSSAMTVFFLRGWGGRCAVVERGGGAWWWGGGGGGAGGC